MDETVFPGSMSWLCFKLSCCLFDYTETCPLLICKKNVACFIFMQQQEMKLLSVQKAHETSLVSEESSIHLSERCSICNENRPVNPKVLFLHTSRRSGSVVECLTGDRGAADSSLIGVTAWWSLS